MLCKIFSAKTRPHLEAEINRWLKEQNFDHETMKFHYAQSVIDDEGGYILEHTVVVFYQPLNEKGFRI